MSGDAPATGPRSPTLTCGWPATRFAASKSRRSHDARPAVFPTDPVRSLLNALTGHVRRALADPATEQATDVWELAIFGHRGNLSFTGIAQPSGCGEAVKRWARDELPRHRGGGASKVRDKVNAVGLLSESMRVRPDHGQTPTALDRVPTL